MHIRFRRIQKSKEENVNSSRDQLANLGGNKLKNIILKISLGWIAIMLIFRCSETGLNCDYIVKGETEEEILINGAQHAIKAHGMNVEDIYFKKIPANFLCQSISKLQDE